jgi:serine phosphatase RsbU (regulator of sigma subunit)
VRGNAVPFRRSGRTINPIITVPPTLDVYVGILPRADVSADFVEIVQRGQRLVAAIGDAPSTGLKSAFIARFIANVFRHLVESPEYRDLREVVDRVDATISEHPFFEWVSMLCVDVDPGRGIATLASAGHAYPLLYTARRRACDRLPLRGQLLHADRSHGAAINRFERRRVEMQSGDVLALVGDGLTEGHLITGDPYGYRFAGIIERFAGTGTMRSIGEAIIEDWLSHHREGDYADDVTLVLISINTTRAAQSDGP